MFSKPKKQVAPKTVKMVRPEDRSPKPVIAEVPADKVAHWQSQGWTVKE